MFKKTYSKLMIFKYYIKGQCNKYLRRFYFKFYSFFKNKIDLCNPNYSKHINRSKMNIIRNFNVEENINRLIDRIKKLERRIK